MRQIALALAALCAGSASAFTFYDGELDSWTGWSATQHRTTGGNPGAYLHWEADLFGLPSAQTIYRSSFVYNPSVSGAITSLNLALDSFRTGPVSVTSGILVTQAGQDYAYTLTSSASGTWVHGNAENRTSNDFNPLLSGSGHPNFTTSGGPIAFGIFVRYFSDGGVQTTGGFDNFLVTTEPVPEPLTYVGMLAGLAMLRRRRS